MDRTPPVFRRGFERNPMEYTLTRSTRKTVSLQIKGGQLIVRVPNRMSQQDIQRFLSSHSAWIEKHMAAVASSQHAAGPKLSAEELQALARQAAAYIPDRVAYYAPLIGVNYGKITIRAQKTRWGSCSAQGNLNFNCLLMLAPPEVIDSVVVHELCHRRQMNHSNAFYQEIDKVFPDYRRYHGWLKQNGEALLLKLPD